MIIVNLAKFLEDHGFGTAILSGEETGENPIFIEKLPIRREGIGIMSRGDPMTRGQRTSMTIDIYSRGSDDINGHDRLKEILKFFKNECFPSCDLPVVPDYSEYLYSKTIIVPTFNVTQVGLDSTDRNVYLASAQITYKEN